MSTDHKNTAHSLNETEIEQQAKAALKEAISSTTTKIEVGGTAAGFFADLENVRLSPDDLDGMGTREILTRIPVRKPHRLEFVRVCSDSAMSVTGAIYVPPREDDDDDVYFVAKPMRTFLAKEMRSVLLRLAISRRGTLFIWPLVLPTDESSQGRSWHETGLKAAGFAETRWVRVIADKSMNGYRVLVAEGQLNEPEWPKDKTFEELLAIAFENRIIISEDHPVIRRLRGR